MTPVETVKEEEIVSSDLLENLILGTKSAEKPVKTNIAYLPDNEFDELD